MKKVFEIGYEFIKNKESIVLASVIKQSGSTPRGTGAKMIIRENKEIVGTIGGGSLEKEVQNFAASLFETKESIIKDFVLTEDDIAKLGMICGGRITVLLQYIDASELNNLNTYKKILEVYQNDCDAWLITCISHEERKCEQFVYALDDEESQVNNETIGKIKGYLNSKNMYIELQDAKYIIEPLSKVSKAFIFGGGHVGLEVAIVLNRLGFHITVIDDRKEFANKTRFSMADEVICFDMTEDSSFEELKIDNNSYIIIVTRGHMYDGDVLAKALKTEAAYIGMIGSIGKRDKIYQRLLDRGYSFTQIKKVYSPIGLPIKAETPQEIAISIAAELINVRGEKNE